MPFSSIQKLPVSFFFYIILHYMHLPDAFNPNKLTVMQPKEHKDHARSMISFIRHVQLPQVLHVDMWLHPFEAPPKFNQEDVHSIHLCLSLLPPFTWRGRFFVYFLCIHPTGILPPNTISQSYPCCQTSNHTSLCGQLTFQPFVRPSSAPSSSSSSSSVPLDIHSKILWSLPHDGNAFTDELHRLWCVLLIDTAGKR